MKLWLISLFDPTPIDEPVYPRFMEIANAAVQKGHSVKHFTSTFRHILKRHRSTQSFVHYDSEKYSVHYIKSLGYKTNFSPKRFYAHYDFAKRLIEDFEKHSKPDIVFISMPPLSTIHKVSKWCEQRNVPLVTDIIDPWPDSFVKDVPKGFKSLIEPLLFPFKWKLREAFRRSSAITAISNDYLSWAKDFHSPEKLVKPFFLAINVEEVFEATKDITKSSDINGKIRLIYAGSMASSYDIPCILKAAQRLSVEYPGKTEFVFTGKGPQLSLVKEFSVKYDNIKYLGWLTKEELLGEYGKSDFGLIQHKNSLTQTITYKFFSYMSAGLILLNSLQSEMAEMINKNGLGMNNKEMNFDELAKNIAHYINNPELIREQRENVKNFSLEFGHAKNVYGRLIEFFEELT